ncbi:MAG TPA: tetratricopeptide repeat protein, partial [Kofleriaceae bacterium]|nr:tetratricopeptide repeat protein [Kofleriaceae bacterium]
EAQAAHQPELGATAAIQRLALSCSSAERALWSGYATAQMPPAGRPHIEISSALAQSLFCEGKIAEATKLRRDIEQALHNDGTAASAGAALDLARAELALGDLSGADTAARRATAIYVRIYGARHPLSQTARLIAAEAELSVPAASAAAIEEIGHVLGELRDHAEPDAVRARALAVQSRLAAIRGQRDEALRLIQHAAQEYEAALGGAHPELAAALARAGDLLLADGRDQEAEASYRQVVAIFETLGHSEAAGLAHARAGIQLARWGARPPADAEDTLQWGLSPTGGTLDPAVAGWIAEQLGRRAAARGDQAGALAHYRAAVTAWQQSGDLRGLASALSEGALLAVELHDADARALLEQALQVAVADKPRLQGELARLLWTAERDRARALARAAIAELPDSGGSASDLKRWLQRHDAER